MARKIKRPQKNAQYLEPQQQSIPRRQSLEKMKLRDVVAHFRAEEFFEDRTNEK